MIKKTLFWTILAIGTLAVSDAMASKRDKARAEVLSRGHGFYKDIFMDSGIALTSRKDLPATKFLGLELEYFASATKDKLSQKDTLRQTNIFCGYEQDTNGWLLYPDGAPRFRMIYVNGGSASKHAKSLDDEGKERVQEFVRNGGSYLGTCAGAYIACKGSMYRNVSKPRWVGMYWALWPQYAHSTHLLKSSPTMLIPKRSPLLRYFDFGGDGKVENVRHNGGCYAFESDNAPMPDGTERLSSYQFENTDKVQINGKTSVWAYKPTADSGRTLLCGSHPEGATSGERLEYMSAMILYAMDGNAAPRSKGLLTAGEVREMNKHTEAEDPAHTRIGDRQYHHFELDVPRKCAKAIIKIEGYKGENSFDLSLCAKRGELAFHDNTLIKTVGKGCKHTLTIERPKSGRWFVSVFCETTVTAHTGKYGTYYRGRVAVLNGVPYKISVCYE